MGYCEDPAMVRVDFFKPSGKWYCTEAVKWLDYGNEEDKSIQDVFRESLVKHLKGRLKGMKAVCLEPYHRNAFPLMVDVPNEE